VLLGRRGSRVDSQLDNAELPEVLRRDLTVVQERDLRTCGMDLFHCGNEQRDDRHHADPAAVPARANVCERRVNAEAACVRHFSRDEREGAARDIEKGRTLVAGVVVQRHARAVGQRECSAIKEANADTPASRSLDDVALTDEIVVPDLNRNAAGPRDSARAYDRFDFADNWRKLTRRLRARASWTTVRRNAAMTGHRALPPSFAPGLGSVSALILRPALDLFCR
jgi:hypothetical protein